MTAGEIVAGLIGAGGLAVAQPLGRLMWGVVQGWRAAASERPSRVAITPAEPTVEQRLAVLEAVRRADAAERAREAKDAAEIAAADALNRLVTRAAEKRRQKQPKETPDDRHSDDPPTDP